MECYRVTFTTDEPITGCLNCPMLVETECRAMGISIQPEKGVPDICPLDLIQLTDDEVYTNGFEDGYKQCLRNNFWVIRNAKLKGGK